jgi:hypothetical protein
MRFIEIHVFKVNDEFEIVFSKSCIKQIFKKTIIIEKLINSY